jgi:hypothetical protein
MKRKLIAIAIAICIIMTAPVSASLTATLDRNGATAGLQGGGELNVNPNLELANLIAQSGSFLTFCLEADEGVDDTGTVVYFASILEEAIEGDGNDDPAGPLGGDLLDPATAWLYTQYLANTLGYDGGILHATALQQAFWHLEDETGFDNYNNLNSQAQTWIDDALAAGWTDIGDVRVLHLWTGDTYDGPQTAAQDVLCIVPEPTSLTLISLSAAFAAMARKRRRN